MANAMDIRECLQIIERSAWSEWKGLREEWSRDNLESIAKELLNCRPYELSGNSAQCCEFPLTQQPQPLQCFFNKDNQLFLLRLEDPKLTCSWPVLNNKMGPPSQKNQLPTEHLYAPSAQYIYAAKGITFYVVELPVATESILSAVSLYSPTSAQTYLHTLGGSETMRFFDDP